MPTTIIPYVPPPNAAFQFQPTFDSEIYTVIVTWNMFRQGNYVSCYQLDGTRVYTLPMTASPLDYDLSFNDGYFTTKLVFRDDSQQFEVIDG